jgi:hypothetical protein
LKPSKKEGVKGMLPLGCLPHGGREGVTLQTVDKKKRISGKYDFNRATKNYNEKSTCDVKKSLLDPVSPCGITTAAVEKALPKPMRG